MSVDLLEIIGTASVFRNTEFAILRFTDDAFSHLDKDDREKMAMRLRMQVYPAIAQDLKERACASK